MRTELTAVTVTGPAESLDLVERAADDLRAAGNIVGDLTLTPSDTTEISVHAEIANAS
jgi:hypothetical protein